MYQSPNSSILLGKQTLLLSENVILNGVEGWQKGITNTNSNLGVYYYLTGNYSISLSHHYKALEIRKQLNDKGGIASSLSNIGIIYYG
ncbi:MAG: hypothetical protein COC01_01590 [Bacteroidetes bacterium]|nr:MAG: hypothetical protein COC01_01590 [Bacteroidota bacterium]